jgi:hypothetical protein
MRLRPESRSSMQPSPACAKPQRTGGRRDYIGRASGPKERAGKPAATVNEVWPE